MRINIASFSGTHPLEVARELDAAGALAKYYTALPAFRVTGLPRARLTTCPALLLPLVALRRVGLGGLEQYLNWPVTEGFDRWLCLAQRDCDVFQVPSSFGLRAIRRARASYGALTVCDHGSSHIRMQDELLAEESARWGMPCSRVDARIIAKEEAEYDEADVVLVPSTFARQSFLRAGVAPEKIVTVPYGVRLETFFPTKKLDEVFRILCVAQLSVRKGIGYLLDAISRLALPNSEVVLRGAALPESEQLLAAHEGRFRLHPPASRHTRALRELYSQASVLVLPSIEDGFGLVMNEAMACGVPVIATTNTGAADLITDGKDGFIVPIRNAQAIAERIEYLYSHPTERAAMGLAALEKVRSREGWGQYTNQLLHAYRERLHQRAS